jgi:hypothetical protein
MQDMTSSTVHPMCPDCRKPMRLAASEMDKTHTTIRHELFVCDCGFASDQMTIPANPSDAPSPDAR